MADQATKEAAGFSPNADGHTATPRDPEDLKTLMATTKAIARQAINHDRERAWDKS
ncbi:hypothetical protein LZ32DRAFT_674101 [Colletotrichum eremochloae]|nr:hypothetical protein LZ32DRAFT_674101 [Colletotrichum eremochloae]